MSTNNSKPDVLPIVPAAEQVTTPTSPLVAGELDRLQREELVARNQTREIDLAQARERAKHD